MYIYIHTHTHTIYIYVNTLTLVYKSQDFTTAVVAKVTWNYNCELLDRRHLIQDINARIGPKYPRILDRNGKYTEDKNTRVNLFEIRTINKIVPCAQAVSSHFNAPSNALQITIEKKHLHKYIKAKNDRYFFPFYAFANLKQRDGTVIQDKVMIIYIVYTGCITIQISQVDIDLIGPYCNRGARTTHLQEFSEHIQYVPQEECEYCMKANNTQTYTYR